MKIRLDYELKKLRELLFTMGKKVEYALSKSITALMTNDSVIAQEVIQDDKIINRLEVKLDQICHKIFALQNPIAIDLRFVASTLKVNNDLERIGDFASNIAEDVVRLIPEVKESPVPFIDELYRQAELAQYMAQKCLEAFMQSNITMAKQLIQDDEKMDALYRQLIHELIPFVHEDAQHFKLALSLINIAKSLERIGDHAVNICENAVYLEKGKIVKHHSNQ